MKLTPEQQARVDELNYLLSELRDAAQISIEFGEDYVKIFNEIQEIEKWGSATEQSSMIH